MGKSLPFLVPTHPGSPGKIQEGRGRKNGCACVYKTLHLSIPHPYPTWELVYEDDLVVIAETEDDLIKKLNEWKDNMENRGMRVNMNKTKVMISGERQKVMQKAVRWPCGVCGRGIGNNSIQCTGCHKLVHRKCSGIKGSMYKVMKTFVCRCCMNPVTGTGCTSVNIGVNANLELVDEFCYLGDMLSVDGDADAAVKTRIRIGWNKFRQLVPFLTNKDISLTVRGTSYRSCVESSMLHGSETWPVRKEKEVALQLHSLYETIHQFSKIHYIKQFTNLVK